MRNTLILSAAISMMATTAFAQSSYNVVVEPVAPTVTDIINAPVEYDNDGVVKAQYFSADDLSEEEYNALLAEADRIRSYQSANGYNDVVVDAPSTTSTYSTETYVSPSTETYSSYSSSTSPTYTSDTYATYTGPSYEIEMIEPQNTYSSAPVSKIHTVSKGDTLYNISKRYDATISAIQTENGLSGNTLSIGQQLRIPGVVSSSENTTAIQPIFASAPVRDGLVTRRIIDPAPVMSNTISASGTQIYAVLPKDTLYSISRRTCVGVQELIATNSISNPNALTPGQRLTLPVGHCLAK